MLINRVAGGTHPFVRQRCISLSPKMRPQLLLEGRVFMQSAGGEGKGTQPRKGSTKVTLILKQLPLTLTLRCRGYSGGSLRALGGSSSSMTLQLRTSSCPLPH